MSHLLIHHPEAFLWGTAVKMARERRFQFSMRCESSLKDQIRSGLGVYKVGLFEFRERASEAEANLQKLVEVMIEIELSLDGEAEVLQESTLSVALYDRHLCPGLWPLC
jgi:hypothetical protein